MSQGYAVVDVETTGLSPAKHDRVAEIAIVQVDTNGRIESEWSTLVNPERDLGPQHIHGISAREARQAPVFADIIGDVAGRLAGRVLVAHNLAFDARFLDAEFHRAGVGMDFARIPGLCTMRLGGDLLPVGGRSLAVCCASAGVQLQDAHAALNDARACAGLLAALIRLAGRPEPWRALLDRCAGVAWPATRATGRAFLRTAAAARPGHFLARLVETLPPVNDPPQADSYLALLDTALLDRQLSATEQDALAEHAASLRLRLDEVVALHRTYLSQLARAAWADGVVTSEEQADLVRVAEVLELGPSAIEIALREAGAGAVTIPAQRSLHRGDRVVFTGQMDQPRESWESKAQSAGLQVCPNVTKKTTLVIAADPDSMSGKARKAHDYGIPIVTEGAFSQLIAKILK